LNGEKKRKGNCESEKEEREGGKRGEEPNLEGISLGELPAGIDNFKQ